jgi:hypothetical protein
LPATAVPGDAGGWGAFAPGFSEAGYFAEFFFVSGFFAGSLAVRPD